MQLREIEILYNELIPLSDGITLSAQIWLPVDATCETPTRVPAILEYLPYRKRDGTAVRDAMNHPYVASRGYACVRVDMRGAGDSEGLLLGEYLKQEQDDAVEVINWIARQRWCSGNVGMMGISWGGFNSLQVAARRPPQLKAIISICSTDDRFGDDIHYKGGCLLTENLTWAASMLAINSSPPDPALVGEDRWREMWLERLNSGGFYAKEWHQHQHRDSFWKHASVGQNYQDIECATYLVGGWADPYTNTIFRMLENLKCPRKGLVGPWGHKYPNFGVPGPQIGFLQEAVRWWDYWLKGEDKTGIMKEPMLRSYLQDPWPPAPFDEFRPGRWVAEKSWSDKGKLQAGVVMGLSPGSLTDEVGTSKDKLSICSPQNLGFSGGRWLVFGIEGEGPGDQRAEAGGSLVFDTKPLDKPLDLLGAAEIKLRIASNKPNALVAATLSEVLPDGRGITRVSYGVLNLTHRNGSDNAPHLLEPGKFYDINVKLNHFGQCIGTGSQLRLALSSTYFPMVWPSPETTTLSIDCAHSNINLPLRERSPLDSTLERFKPAINGALPKTDLRQAKHNNFVRHDWDSNRTELCVFWDDGKWEVDATGWRFGNVANLVVGVSPNDPLSATVEQTFDREFGRGELSLRTKGWTRMKVTELDMLITAYVEAWEGEKKIFEKEYSVAVPRNGV